MSDRMQQLQTFVRGFTPKQWLLLIGATVVVVTVLSLFVYFGGAPEYRTVYSGLSSSDAQALAAKLTARNIRAEVTPDNTGVRVPADQVDRARLEVAADGVPQGGRLGFELFDKPDWTISDFAEQVNYQRALEGELERTIGSIRGVESARVHLTLSKPSLFADQERPAKAAVVLRMHGSSLPPGVILSIQNLVASAAENLRPENVNVINSSGNLSTADADDAQGHEPGLERQLAAKIVATVAPLVGPEHVRANVTVDFDSSTSDATRETYDPNSTVALTHQKSEQSAGMGRNGGVPGVASNMPNGTPATASSDSTHSTTENSTYAVNRTVEHTVTPAGRIRRITTAVLIDTSTGDSSADAKSGARRLSADELKQVENLVRASVGFDEKRGDSVVVQGLSFAEVKTEAPATPTLTERVTVLAEKWQSMLRYVALLLIFAIVYALVLRPVKKQMVQALQAAGTRALASAAPVEAAIAVEATDTARAKRLETKQQLLKRIESEPAEASRLISSWIRQPGKKP